MIESPQLFGSLVLASQRNGSAIKLPRSKDEVVMLAFDQRHHRLVELHILTGKTAPAAGPAQTTAIRRVKPTSYRPSRKLAAPQPYGRNAKPGGYRGVRKSRVRLKYADRFYQNEAGTGKAESQTETVDADLQRTACELLRGAADMRVPSFMTILDVGIDDGLAYYVTKINDGEFVQDYVKRRGAVPTVTSLALMHQLLQDLGRAEEEARLVPSMGMDRVLVTSREEEYLQLRVFDYGLSQRRPEANEQSRSQIIREACQLFFLLVTGKVYSGGNPDEFSVIAELPASLRYLIKSVLTSPKAALPSIKALRDEFREALCSLVTLVQARNPKMLLVAEPATLPLSHLQGLLLGESPLKGLFGTSFEIEDPELAGSHPFAIPAVAVGTDQPVTLHLLPPERIVSESDFMALPPQVWRQEASKQPNLLPMTGLWKGPDWSFISEVREPGMSLSSLMAKRGVLNPSEVILLLQQIQAGLAQAVETGVKRADLEPASIQLCVGYDGAVLTRDLERLHQKRLDAWPKFMVKLRLHKTMRSLCKPRVIDLRPWEYQPGEELAGIAARDERHRAFIGLAAYLLTGEGRIREIAEFPTGMPEQAAGYVMECLEWVRSGAAVPAPTEFTERLQQLLTAASSEPSAEQPALALQEMESAGFVSDFEEDWALMERSKEAHLPLESDSLRTLDFNGPRPPKASFSWMALAATMVLLGALGWMILGDLPAVPDEKLSAARLAQAEPAAGVSEKRPAAAAEPAAVRPQAVVHKYPAVVEELVEPLPPPSPAPAPELSPPLMTERSAVLVASSSEPAVTSAPEVVEAREERIAEKVEPASQPTAELVATAVDEVSRETAAAEEPVTIRRAIPAEAIDEKPGVGGADGKALASTPPTPPSPEPPPAEVPIVATHKPPSMPGGAAAVVADTQSPPAPEQVATLDAVTIRHAIVVSPEEVQQALRSPGKSRNGKKRR